ncbi:uncharacterized protein LOC119966567 isoform X3 [Scyliorhinus canicula]|uniref:uncharacterized protein LOC119966567 isoform X3 n=1 Tax=Scyliorhinus canicula TaxID=7830 RepID=UPI0018F3A8E7|nr:uncharacterized protein LOC119966567 isoform X3 [Scyliorhinus canicula]
MESSGGDNSPSPSGSAGSNSWMRSWDNSSTFSALNIGSGSEVDGGDEDKEIASKAVAFVIRSSRKGVVPLCADVANLLKIKWRLERTIKAQQLEIHRLLSTSRAHCNHSSTSTQTNSSILGSPLRAQSVSQKHQPQEILSMECTYHENGTGKAGDSGPHDREAASMACRCANQDSSLASYREEQCVTELTNRTDDGRLRTHSLTCTLPTKEGQLQTTSHASKARSPDFLVDATLSCSGFPFPMVGCQCSSCVSFFNNYKLTNGHNGHDKEIKPLLHLQRQKLPININDYVIVNGNKSGTARYIGHLDGCGMANAVFVGVELDEPSGLHDGTFEGKRYFQCYANFAIFVPVHEIFYVINKKPKKSISPPTLSSMQHRHSLGSLSSLTNNSGARGEHGHQAHSRKKKQHVPKNFSATKRVLRKSGASTSSRTSNTSVIPSPEDWSESNERIEKASVSSLQPKISNRASTITVSLPPDFTQCRPPHASNRVSPRKVSRY